MELYFEDRTVEIERIDENIRGFGIYTLEGEQIIRQGSIPETVTIGEQESPQQFLRIDEDTVRLMRVVGRMMRPREGLPPLMGRGMMRGMNRGPMMAPETAAPKGLSDKVLVVDYDISEFDHQRNLVLLLFGGALLIFSGLVVFALFLIKRVQTYRENEVKQQHLLQLGLAARTLTHEIKNPLGAIELQKALLKKKFPDRGQKELQVMEEELNRIDHLVERVRDFVKDPRGKPQKVDVAAFIRDLNRKTAYPVTIVEEPENSSYVMFDMEKLRSVLENVIRNAHESMEDQQPVEIGIRPHQNRLVITIADRGKGIPEGELDRLFDPFYTTKHKGSGVGLAVAKRFVEAMGGDIRLEPRREGGTVCTIQLPLVEPGSEDNREGGRAS
jgi:signal transduction histidine kinase